MSRASVQTITAPRGLARFTPWRWALASLGLVLAGIGLAGVFIPGLPTFIFVLLASYCFSKSCPWLEERVLRNRWLGPSMRIIDGERPFTRRARCWVLAAMWTSVGISLGVLWSAGRLTPALAWSVPAAALVGTACVFLYRRGDLASGPVDHQGDGVPAARQ
ncbi:MAG: YbaN family protein [Phycisphaeraceae bacterium]|nr:MAG: YbaN family protein [Phycisphaeraceae bacterium]